MTYCDHGINHSGERHGCDGCCKHKSKLCARWLHDNGWSPNHKCACETLDYTSQILKHCEGCAELLDCDEERKEHWCSSCWHRHERDAMEKVIEAVRNECAKFKFPDEDRPELYEALRALDASLERGK